MFGREVEKTQQLLSHLGMPSLMPMLEDGVHINNERDDQEQGYFIFLVQ